MAGKFVQSNLADQMFLVFPLHTLLTRVYELQHRRVNFSLSNINKTVLKISFNNWSHIKGAFSKTLSTWKVWRALKNLKLCKKLLCIFHAL